MQRTAEINQFLTSLNSIISLTKTASWAGHVAHMAERRDVYRVLVGETLRERDHLEDPDGDGRMILRWIFSKWDVGAWTGLIWLRIGTGEGQL